MERRAQHTLRVLDILGKVLGIETSNVVRALNVLRVLSSQSRPLLPNQDFEHAVCSLGRSAVKHHACTAVLF